MELRKFSPKYLPEIFVGLLDFKTIKNLGLLEPKTIIKKLKETFGKAKSYSFLIFHKNKLIGEVNFTKGSEGIYRIGMFLFKEHQNKGFGKKAFKKILAYSKKQGWKKLVADTNKNNLAINNLLKSFDARKVKENENEIFWEKKLK